uniref:Uncharacterized protein n=2 Tax=Acrobeloides nanus TaxID=290746 RepID=A0A914ENW7_9BILA
MIIERKIEFEFQYSNGRYLDVFKDPRHDSIAADFNPYVRNESQDVKFQVYPKNKTICEKMVNDAMEDPESFLHKINLYFEYTMKIGKQESREVNVTSQNLIDSKTFSILNNTYENKNGVVYLTSFDMNTFSKEILSPNQILGVSTINNVTMDEEDRLIDNLIRGLQEEQVAASKLPHDEWDSVFWNDLFSRPDIETSYLENTFTDQDKDRFIYSSEKEKEFFGHLQDKLDETTFFAILSYYIKRVMFVYMYRRSQEPLI